MKTFLVPVDFSAVTDQVIAAALDFARAFQGRIALLHVVQPTAVSGGEYTLPVAAVEETVRLIQAGAEAGLIRHQAFVQQAGIDCSFALATGDPVPLIREEAARLGADYVIMGSHGHGKLYDFLVGSTASGVLKQARCGVIIIPPADQRA